MVWVTPMAIGVTILLVIVLLMYGYDLSWTHAVYDSITSVALLTTAVWVSTKVIQNYPTKVGLLLYTAFVSIVFSTLAVVIFQLIFSTILNDIYGVNYYFITKSVVSRYLIAGLICSWVTSLRALAKKHELLEEKYQRQADANTLLREAELFKLRQQLQPHFLYNSLNSISALTMIDTDKAQEMINKLSDFLRSSVSRETKNIVPIQEEIRYIESYLAIEAVRFGNRLNVHIDNKIKNDKEVMIPPFLLQPILENAIKFGLYGQTNEVSITVCLTIENGLLKVVIINPYDQDGGTPKGTGFGLKGISRRLYLLYARADLLEVYRDEHIFTTTLKIPQS